MKYIDSISNDIYFNLALEEYVFHNFKDDTYFLLWDNDNSIVLGKYQNVFEEINIKAVEKMDIKVARRNSGGGTVFHDKGNLNYSIITDYDKNSFIDYDIFINPVITALNSLGIHAEKRRTSDIVIEGKKISGSAQSCKNDRILHHGTLLFNADLSMLENLLKTTDGKIESKSVKSVRSSVTNIKEHIDDNITLDDFKTLLLNSLFPNGVQKVFLTEDQIAEVNNLVKNKYSQWQWNYGNSPEFSYEKESELLDMVINIKLHVKKGIIETCIIEGDKCPCKDIETAAIGTRYNYNEITDKLKEIKSLEKINIEELADCFF